ncbi:MAG: hypothetical protein Q4F27_06520, partial [Desulfovibrionaceae bacterium]|nr:hypothetical protein [Desulfovibrionaceae bacterium]
MNKCDVTRTARRLLAVMLSVVLLFGNAGTIVYADTVSDDGASVLDAPDPLGEDYAEGDSEEVTDAPDIGEAEDADTLEAAEVPDAEAAAPEAVMEEEAEEEALAGDAPELTMTQDGGWYVIKEMDDWNNLVDYVAGGGNTRDKKFILRMHFTCLSPVGTEDNPFRGTFDGNNKMVNYYPTNVSGETCGLFRYAEDARFIYTRVYSAIPAGAASAGALVGRAYGNVEISYCASMGDSRDSGSGSGGNYGGLVGTGEAGSLVRIDRSVVSNKVKATSADRFGGFVGWSDGEVSISECLFAPDQVEVGATEKSVFFNAATDQAVENAYYT